MRKAHPKYKRVLKSNKKFYAHDEQNLPASAIGSDPRDASFVQVKALVA